MYARLLRTLQKVALPPRTITTATAVAATAQIVRVSWAGLSMDRPESGAEAKKEDVEAEVERFGKEMLDKTVEEVDSEKVKAKGKKATEAKETPAPSQYVTRAAKEEAKRRQKVADLKEKLAAMSREQRREELYRCGPKGYKTVEKDTVDLTYVYKKFKLAPSETAPEPSSALNAKLRLFRGDITTLEVDAIVNAANTRCLGGAGVDGAIHRAAGDYLYEECLLLNGCPTGDAKATGGYQLPADFVFHAVGPMGKDPEALASAYKACLSLAAEHKIASIAFPCISTGIYGYPNRAAARVVLATLREWLEEDEYADSLHTIVLCLFLDKDVQAYLDALPHYFPDAPPSGGKAKKAKESSI